MGRGDDAGDRPTVLLLGPVELSHRGRTEPLAGAKLRAILAQLALAEGRAVSVDQLIDGVWGEDPSGNVRNTLQYHIGVLRKALIALGAADVLATRPPGYALDLGTDLGAFNIHRAAGDNAIRRREPAEAAAAFASALGCWRGDALADLREFPFAAARAVALDEQRMACLEAWVDSELQCDRVDILVPQLQGLVVEHPTRERLWEQLMIALYRTGRQSDALKVYARAREALDRELGVEPTARLRAVQLGILRQDPLLSGPAVPRKVASSLKTRLAAVDEAASAALIGAGGIRLRLNEAPVELGRHSGCDLVLSDEEASRRHARIVATRDGHAVLDLDSTNGTYINGVRVYRLTELADGDRIEIGHLLLRYQAAR